MSGVAERARWCAIGMLALLLSACIGGTRGGPIPYNVQNFGHPDPEATQLVGPDYKLAPMDTIKVTVFQVPELSGDFDVDLMGNIAMPLIGSVKAADLTPGELDQEVSRKLTEKYLQNPDVTISLKSSSRRNITIDGAVSSPGMYALNGPTTLIQAIAMARGVSDAANPRRIAIFRQIEGKRMAAAFDLTSIRRGEMPDPPVYRGDIIIVDGTNIGKIQGQILSTLPIIGLFNPIF